ncbi:MAG: hypothetical protein AB8G99_18755 [Planctomycetaceae bacterium]
MDTTLTSRLRELETPQKPIRDREFDNFAQTITEFFGGIITTHGSSN